MPIPDWDTRRFDYWIVRYCRGISVITIYIIGPLLQIGIPRILPLVFTSGFLILCLGHAITRGRYLPIQTLKSVFNPTNWSNAEKIAYYSYGLFVAWMTISIIWSPLRMYALRDVLLLLIFLPLCWFIAVEQATNSNREFISTVVGGVLVAALFVVLEMKGVTNFVKMTSDKNQLFDLNRNAILLVLLCWTPLLFLLPGKLDRLIYVLVVCAVGVAIFMTQSESAKLCFIAALLAGLLVWRIPFSSRLFAYLLAAGLLLFPLILPKISGVIQDESIELLKQGHAHHRAAVWLGYNKLIGENPIFGHGARADRYMGRAGLAPPVDPEQRYATEIVHPHNFIFEIWLNFGLIGALLASSIILALERISRKFNHTHLIVSTQILVASYVYLSVGSSMLQGWWITTLAMTYIVFLVGRRQGMKIRD